MEQPKYDGTRRYAIHYKTKGDPSNGVQPSVAVFYSDALTSVGAWEHFQKCVGFGYRGVLRTVKPDDWLDKGGNA